MSDVPTQVILAVFKTENGADEALQQLKSAEKQHLIDIDNVAVLKCDAEGKLRIKEPTDMGGGRGAVLGGAVGAVAGLLLGPVGWATVGGAAIGGLAAKLRDSGFKDERLRKLGQSLQPGTSAIVAVIEHTWVKQVEAELAQAGADQVTEELANDIASELKSGHSVAYTALAADDVLVVARATDAPPAEAASKEGEKPAEAAPAAPTTPASNPPAS